MHQTNYFINSLSIMECFILHYHMLITENNTNWRKYLECCNLFLLLCEASFLQCFNTYLEHNFLLLCL